MKVWTAIAKTLGCVCCVSNPEASPVQLSGPPDPPGASNTHPVLKVPAPADTHVDPADSDATDEDSIADGPPCGWQDFKDTAKGALGIILKIAKEASVPLPPLQAALGGVVAAKEVSDVSTS